MRYIFATLVLLVISAASYAQCTADFDWETDQLEFEFENFSFGNYDSVWIDFGDGNGSNDSNVVYTYDSAGSYTVCLSLYTSGVFCDSVCYPVFMSDTFCEANFSFDVDELSVDFTNESEGPYNAQFWDFGDGFGFSENADPSYTYFDEDTYEVCLFVYDSVNFSCESEYCEDITVEGEGGGGQGPCDAKYTYTANELEISFKNFSTGGLITTWDFGDGTPPSFDEEPVHLFAEPGEYEVCLTIISPFPFCTDQFCEIITVVEYTCEPDFAFSSNLSTNTYTFFDSTRVGNVTSVLWEFGDGNTSTFEQPIYTYNNPGPYKVCLTTYDEGNECGKICKDINVFPLGQEELATGQSLKVYPNPNNGSFYIQLNQPLSGASRIQITDVSGRVLAQEISQNTGESIEMNLDLESGAYFVRIIDENSTVSVSPFVVR